MPNLDAVIIATPPHWHALPFIDACKKGLAIYAEKPLGYDIREGRAMVNAWKQAGNIVKCGFQRRTGANFNAARDYIRSGNAGRIVQVDVNIHYQRRSARHDAAGPARLRLIGSTGAVPRRSFPTARTSDTRRGVLKRSTGTGTWSIGASTSST